MEFVKVLQHYGHCMPIGSLTDGTYLEALGLQHKNSQACRVLVRMNACYILTRVNMGSLGLESQLSFQAVVVTNVPQVVVSGTFFSRLFVLDMIEVVVTLRR